MKATTPTRKIAAISNEVATGRRINGRDGLRGIALRVRRQKLLLGYGDLRAVLQLLKAAVGYHIAIVQSLHRGISRFTYARLDVVNMRHAVLNQENERRVSVVLNSRGGNQDLVLQRDAFPAFHLRPCVVRKASRYQ